MAIDVPGFGRTDSPAIDGLVNVKLLAEVIRSLAKQHAFAIVAFAQGAAAMLTTLLAEPKLTSFLVPRLPLAFPGAAPPPCLSWCRASPLPSV